MCTGTHLCVYRFSHLKPQTIWGRNFDLHPVFKSGFPNCIGFPGDLCCFIARVDARGILAGLMAWFSSVQFSRSVVSDSLRPYEPQHARLQELYLPFRSWKLDMKCCLGFKTTDWIASFWAPVGTHHCGHSSLNCNLK